MTTSHVATALSTPCPQVPQASALQRLRCFLHEHETRSAALGEFADFEQMLGDVFAAAQREVTAQEMARHDVNVPVVLIDGVKHHRRLREPNTYMTRTGEVTVTRTLYSTREDGARCQVPMELKCGIIAGFFTPDAGRIAALMHAHLTPGEAAGLFQQLGGMKPSRSTLDRLPKVLSEQWERMRPEFEAALDQAIEIPDQAVSVAVSLDGVMAPMRDGDRVAKREASKQKGKMPSGPAGFQEVGCATLSFFDVDGERLSTLQMARMPESKKLTLKETMGRTLHHILALRPSLTLVKVADGAKDNWAWLEGKSLPKGESVVDFYHVAEHLAKALALVYGESTEEFSRHFKPIRHKLRHEPDGAERVIRALQRLVKLHPKKAALRTELNYFRTNRHRMRYQAIAARKLPIGSGIVEAACKTLVTQRLKRSGMRWRPLGGQATLTLRALVLSNQFDLAWPMLAAQWTGIVDVVDNVIPWPQRAVAG